MADTAHVFVADDDPVVRDVVRRYLERDGYIVTEAEDGHRALAALMDPSQSIDLAILDVMMPGPDGIEVCRMARAGDRPNIPIILLTALGETEDRVVGLEAGADDYVSKPFSPRELSLRVAGVLRRTERARDRDVVPDVIDTGTITLDCQSQSVTVAGRPIATTSREFDLLHFFLTHQGVVFSREELLSSVWNWSFGDLSTVTVHVKRVRAKLGDAQAIDTVWGRGYRWTPASDTA